MSIAVSDKETDHHSIDNTDSSTIVYFIDDKYEAVCRYLENLPSLSLQSNDNNCNQRNNKIYNSTRVNDPYDSRCNFIFTNLAKIDFLKIANGVLVNNLKGSQHLSNKAYLAYHVKASGKEYLMPLQWSAAYDDISSLVGMLIVTTLYNYCHHLIDNDTNNSSIINNDKELREIIQLLLMDAAFRQSSDYSLLTLLLSSFPNFMTSIDEYDHEGLVSTLGSIDSQQNWRKAWAGKQDIWIIKPVGLSCGENIHVFKGFKDVLIHTKAMKYKCIVQKYIERPLLVRNGRKFDIRQWVLVSNVDPLIVYGFSECYLRLSSKGYTLDSQDLLDATVHLTNHAIQKHSIVDSGNEDTSLVCDTMMTQQQFDEALHQLNQNNDTVFGNSDATSKSIFNTIIKPQIKKIAIDAITSVRDMLRKVGDGYQWLGLDLMVTEDLQVLLIEVNVSPDISFSTPITARLVTAGVADLMRLVIHEGKVRSCYTKDNNTETIDDNKLSSLSLQWELWHYGIKEGFQKTQSFTKKKNEYAILSKNYNPRNENLANKVMKILNPTIHDDDDDDDIEEDEI